MVHEWMMDSTIICMGKLDGKFCNEEHYIEEWVIPDISLFRGGDS